MMGVIIFLLLVLVAIVLWGLVVIFKALKNDLDSIEKAKNWPQIFDAQIRASIRKHKYNLNQESKRLTIHDAYGNADKTQWENEGINYFITNILWPEIGLSDLSDLINAHDPNDLNSDLISPARQKILQMIAEEIDGITSPSKSDNDINQLSGLEFESFCKDILEGAGWHTTTTIASGDQGVDLIATKGGIRVCIQCKRYGSPVGNSAIQEVTAGKLHWQGTHAVVVSNAGFTYSAKVLARSTGVLLVSHEELIDLEKRLE
jgi:restriction system protein